MYVVAIGPAVSAVLVEAELAAYLAAHPDAAIVTLLDAQAGLLALQQQLYADAVERAAALLLQPLPLAA